MRKNTPGTQWPSERGRCSRHSRSDEARCQLRHLLGHVEELLVIALLSHITIRVHRYLEVYVVSHRYGLFSLVGRDRLFVVSGDHAVQLRASGRQLKFLMLPESLRLPLKPAK